MINISVSHLFKRQASLGTDMRQIFVILVFLPALICAKPLEDDEIFVDVEKITDHPDSSEPRQGKKEEINENVVGHDCVDYRKKLEECLRRSMSCFICPSSMINQAIMECAENYKKCCGEKYIETHDDIKKCLKGN